MEKITKEEIQKIMAHKGEVKGEVFRTDMAYILREKGEKGLKEVEKKTEEWGYPIDYENMVSLRWYSAGLRVLSILAIKETFNLTDEDIKKMGWGGPKYSFIVKVLLKYIISIEKVFKAANTYWAKHYSFGAIEPIEIDEKKKTLIVHLKGYKIHPIMCKYYEGYFPGIASFTIKNPETMTCQETRCMFEGYPYHEYLMKWE